MAWKDYKTLLNVLSILLEVCVILEAGKERREGKLPCSELTLPGDLFHMD